MSGKKKAVVKGKTITKEKIVKPVEKIIELEEIVEEKEMPLEEKEIPMVAEKKRFLMCPFCGEKSYELHGRDVTSSWCQSCGRCYPAVWQEEM